MNILLVNPRTGNKYTKPPLGLLSVGTVCKQLGHKVTILDAALLNMSALGVALEADSYNLVGLTAMTPMIYEAAEIAIEVKRRHKPVILGGVHATLFPDDMFLTGLFNAVVDGEGEGVIEQLLADFEGNKLQPIYKADGYVSIPTPDYSLIDIGAYHPRYPHAEREPWTSVQTSRGCPYSCTFCSNIFGKKYRSMSASQIYNLLDQLSTEYGIKDITFYDDEFTIGRVHIMELCQLLVSRPLDIRWTCESRVDLVDGRLLKMMRKAGCRLIFYGIETGDRDILRSLDKGINFSQVRKAVELTQDVGIKAAGYFMLGCPRETAESMQRTVEFAVELGLDHAQFSVCSPIPGSRLYEQYGIKADWADFQYLAAGINKVYCPTEVSHEQIEAKVLEANALFNKEKE